MHLGSLADGCMCICSPAGREDHKGRPCENLCVTLACPQRPCLYVATQLWGCRSLYPCSAHLGELKPWRGGQGQGSSTSELRHFTGMPHWCTVCSREEGVRGITSEPVTDLQAISTQGTGPSDSEPRPTLLRDNSWEGVERKVRVPGREAPGGSLVQRIVPTEADSSPWLCRVSFLPSPMLALESLDKASIPPCCLSAMGHISGTSVTLGVIFYGCIEYEDSGVPRTLWMTARSY